MKSEPAPAAKSGDGGKSGNYSSAAEKMMAMMGYKSGDISNTIENINFRHKYVNFI